MRREAAARRGAPQSKLRVCVSGVRQRSSSLPCGFSLSPLLLALLVSLRGGPPLRTDKHCYPFTQLALKARVGPRGCGTFRSRLAEARAWLFSPSSPNMVSLNHGSFGLAARSQCRRNSGSLATPPGTGAQAVSGTHCSIMCTVQGWDCTKHTIGIDTVALSCRERVNTFFKSLNAVTERTA